MMRAAVLNAIGSPYEVADIDIDKPADDEVLVRTTAAGLCHSDLQFVTGRKSMPTPFVAGHESAGVIEAVGSRVTYVKPGDRVVTYLNAFCGQCRFCLRGQPFLCRAGSTTRPPDAAPRLSRRGERIDQFFNVSSFAEQLLVHQSQVAKVPEAISLDKAALLGCAALTGIGAVFHTAQVRPGDNVAVFGCGGVGLNIVQGARLAGAQMIIAIDPVPEKRDLAMRLGATHSFAPKDDLPAELVDLSGGGLEHAFDAIGMSAVGEQCLASVARGGAATIVGMMADDDHLRIGPLDMVIGKRVLGCSMGSNRARLDIPLYAEMYVQGRLNLDLVSGHVPLVGINDAIDALKSGRVLRTVVSFGA